MGQIKIRMPEPELIPGMAYERNPDGTIKTEVGAGGGSHHLYQEVIDPKQNIINNKDKL